MAYAFFRIHYTYIVKCYALSDTPTYVRFYDAAVHTLRFRAFSLKRRVTLKGYSEFMSKNLVLYNILKVAIIDLCNN